MSKLRGVKTDRDRPLNQTLEGHRLVVVEDIKISRVPQQQPRLEEPEAILRNKRVPPLACGTLETLGCFRLWGIPSGTSRHL